MILKPFTGFRLSSTVISHVLAEMLASIMRRVPGGDGTVLVQSRFVLSFQFSTGAHCTSTYPVKTLLNAMFCSTIHVQKYKGKLTPLPPSTKTKNSVHTYPWIKIVQHQAFKLDCYITAEC